MKHTDMNVNLQDFFWFVCFFLKKKGQPLPALLQETVGCQ